MYSEITGGSSLNIQGLECHIPPEGYVIDMKTGELSFRGVFSRSDKPDEQYWERQPLPEWYKQKTKEEDNYERRRKEDDPPFYDAKLEEYIATEWDRRLNGYWFMNKGVATYLVGSHYVFMQWWQIDIGYPRFRQPDLEYFYFLQYCLEDPDCMGMLEITKRRFGKTFRGGLFLYEYPTRTRMANAGIQSKTGKDAGKVFAKAVVSPFKKLPRFFRPEYDMSLGITPKTALRFQQTNVKGKKAEESLDKEELGSMIDHESADVIAYDGQKLHRYFCDEWAKTAEANVYDRHDVIRYCLLDDEGKIIGKALYSSTVEKVDTESNGVQEAAITLWNDSDQMNKNMETGRTASGLYRFFMSADFGKNFDIYGFPNVEKNIREILADRKSIAHNIRALSKRIKKEPRTIQEAFSTDGDTCIFNIVNIDRRGTTLAENPIPRRHLLFYRDLDQKVKFFDVKPEENNFHWVITVLPPTGEENRYFISNKLKTPMREAHGAMTVDGYSNSQGGQKYGSRASVWIGVKFDSLNPHNTGKAIGWLYGRPAIKETLHEQVLLAAEYYSYPVWYEHNSDDYLSYFKDRGAYNYLGLYPLSTIDPTKRTEADRYRGFPTTPFSLTKQVDTGIMYFENYIDLIDYPELLEDAKGFDPNDRTKSDITVSFLMLLVCLMETKARKIPLTKPLVKTYPNPNYKQISSNQQVKFNQ